MEHRTKRLLTDHELQFRGLQSVGKLTVGMATMLHNLAVDSIKNPTSQLNVLFTTLLSDKNDNLTARVDLLSSIVKLALFWDAETTPSQLHEPQLDMYNIRLWGDAEILLPSTAGYVSTSPERELSDYWKRYLDGTLPFFKALRLAEKTFFHLGRAEWPAREVEILGRLNQKQPQQRATRQDPLAGLKGVAVNSLLYPISLQNTTFKEYLLTRVSLKPVPVSSHLQIVGNIAETFWNTYAHANKNFWANVTYQTEETLTATTSAFKSVNSSIGKGESFKVRMQDYVKRMLQHPEHALKSQTGYIVPIVLGDASYRLPEIDANHLIPVNEILETVQKISRDGVVHTELVNRLEFFFSLPETHTWRTERRVLHPVAYTYLLYETTHIEQTAFPMMTTQSNGEDGQVQHTPFTPERWDVFTGRPMHSYEDGFYQTHFLRHGAPITLCVSYETCRRAGEEVLRRERRRRHQISVWLVDEQNTNSTLCNLMNHGNIAVQIPQQGERTTTAAAATFGAKNFFPPSVDFAAAPRDSTFLSPPIYSTIGDRCENTVPKFDFCNLTELALFLHCCLHRPENLKTPEEHASEMDLGIDDDDMMVADNDFALPYEEEKSKVPAAAKPKAASPASAKSNTLPPKPAPPKATLPKIPVTAAPQKTTPKVPAKPASAATGAAPKTAPSVPKKPAAASSVDDEDSDDIQVVSVVSKPAPAKKPLPAGSAKNPPPAAPKKKSAAAASGAVLPNSISVLDDLNQKMAMMNEMYKSMQQTMALMAGAVATAATSAPAKKASAPPKAKSSLKQMIKQQKKHAKVAVSDEELCEVDEDAAESDNEPVVDDAKADLDDVERMFVDEADGLGDEDSDKEDRFEKKVPEGYRGSSNADFLYLTPRLDELSEKRFKADREVIEELEATGVVWYRPWSDSSYLTCLNSSPAAAILCSILIGTDSKNRDLRAPAFADSTIKLLAAIAEQSPTHFVQVLANRNPKDPRYKVFTAISTFLRNLLILQDDVQKWGSVHGDVPFLEARPKDSLEALFTIGKDIQMKDGTVIQINHLIDALCKDDIDWNEQILKFLSAADALMDPSLSLLENVANLADNLDIKQSLYTTLGDTVLRALAYMFSSTKEEDLVEITANPRYRELEYIEHEEEVVEVLGKRNRGGNASQVRLAELVKKYCRNDDEEEDSDVYEAPKEDEEEDDEDDEDVEEVEAIPETEHVAEEEASSDGEEHQQVPLTETDVDSDRMDVVVYDDDAEEEQIQDQQEPEVDEEEAAPPVVPAKKRSREETPPEIVDDNAENQDEQNHEQEANSSSGNDEGETLEEPAAKRPKLELTYEPDEQEFVENDANQEEEEQEQEQEAEADAEAPNEQVQAEAEVEQEETPDAEVEGQEVEEQEVDPEANVEQEEAMEQEVQGDEQEPQESQQAQINSQHVLGEDESEITNIHEFMPPVRDASTRVITSMDKTEEFMDDVMETEMNDANDNENYSGDNTMTGDGDEEVANDANPVTEDGDELVTEDGDELVTNDDNPVTDDYQGEEEDEQEEEQVEEAEEEELPAAEEDGPVDAIENHGEEDQQ